MLEYPENEEFERFRDIGNMMSSCLVYRLYIFETYIGYDDPTIATLECVTCT